MALTGFCFVCLFFPKGKKKSRVADAGFGEKEGETPFGKQPEALPWCLKLFRLCLLSLPGGGTPTEVTRRALEMSLLAP